MCACADCGKPVGQDHGPPNGWQLEDGRTVCHACCVADTRQIVEGVIGRKLEPRKAGDP
mgnify:CR=1